MSERQPLPEWVVNLYALHSLKWVPLDSSPDTTWPVSAQDESDIWMVVCTKCGQEFHGANQSAVLFVHPERSNWVLEEYVNHINHHSQHHKCQEAT